MTITLQSHLDQSANFVIQASPGFFEARYVERAGRSIMYLSSQSGCEKACRMCWLTATGQTEYRNAGYFDYINQINEVHKYTHNNKKRFNTLHINFMARGEPFSNTSFVDDYERVIGYAAGIFEGVHVIPIISTIFPTDFGYEKLVALSKMRPSPRIYWSSYSHLELFRKRWLPKAHNFDTCIDLMQTWQHLGGKDSRTHFCFIKDENDNGPDVQELGYRLHESRVHLDVNIVRYNPPNNKTKESNKKIIQGNIQLLSMQMPYSKVYLIDRVGTDVFASCGQFYSHDK